MYLIALLVFILGLLYSVVVGNSLETALSFYDIPSLIIIALITIPMLLASGLFGDLKRAFKVIMFKKMVYTRQELQCSLEAIKLTVKLLLFSGIFGSLIGLMNILRFCYDNLQALGPNLSVMLLPFLYSLFGCFIFLPIQSKIKVLILSASEKK